jgi:hypothetical protein
MFGSAPGIGQAQLWIRARASAAGRTILASGAGVYGLRTAAEGLDWLQGYNAFQAAPTTPPPGGDEAVPVGGGLSVSQVKGRAVTVVLSREARAVLRLIPLDGGRSRVVGKIEGPTPSTGRAIELPADLAPGHYKLITVALGSDLKDVSNVPVSVNGDWASKGVAHTLALSKSSGALRLSVGSGYRAVVRLIGPNGRPRVIAKVVGPARQRLLRLPTDLVPGAYRAVAVAVGSGGRQGAGVRLRVGG